MLANNQTIGLCVRVAERRRREKIVSVSISASRAVAGLEPYSIGMTHGNEEATQAAPLLDLPADLKAAGVPESRSPNLFESSTSNAAHGPSQRR